MTDFEDQRSVWTDFDDEDWKAHNGGSPAMVIGHGLSHNGARLMCERLLMLRPDLVFTVKDNRNSVITTFELRPPVTTPGGEQPKRRPLGRRGT